MCVYVCIYTYICMYMHILKKYYEALWAIILQLISISDSCVFHLIKEHTVWKLVRFEPFHMSLTCTRKERKSSLFLLNKKKTKK